ncbi:hypothetical protein HmCmsJML288_03442 [Escherichia coli]|nr:hypothetical protein HmCmsJML288_03442 [Escherichia coli]
MCYYVFRLDVITGNNIFRQRNKRLNLCRFKRGKIFHSRRFLPATVFQLNANRGVVKARCPAPGANPRMPGQFLFRHQLPDARFTVVSRWHRRDQIMRADLLIGQCRQRAIKIICGVVDHQHFNARIRRLRLASGIKLISLFLDNAFFACAPCQ